MGLFSIFFCEPKVNARKAFPTTSAACASGNLRDCCLQFVVTEPSAPIVFPYTGTPYSGGATLYGIRGALAWQGSDPHGKAEAWWRQDPNQAHNPSKESPSMATNAANTNNRKFFIVPAGQNAFYIAFPRTPWNGGMHCYGLNNDNEAWIQAKRPTPHQKQGDCSDHPESEAQMAACCEELGARKFLLTLP